MDIAEFDYSLPEDLIAQEPVETRDAARLMCLDRSTGACSHYRVSHLVDLLDSGDLLVVNDTRVVPARLYGRRNPTGGAVECLLLSRIDKTHWEALVHPGQKLKVGARVDFGTGGHRLQMEVVGRHYHGRRTVVLSTDGGDVDSCIEAIGHVPLPPYIKRLDSTLDRKRYQTVYARSRGSVAAPTAGLHFTQELLGRLQDRGVSCHAITLHVGYGTFEPVRTQDIAKHRVASEEYEVPFETADAVNRALDTGRRIVAVGTTTTRTLEAVAAANGGRLIPGRGRTDLCIYGHFEFRVINGLLTNFHLPRSSLLLLVAAFAGREKILRAYGTAVAHRYRFYSYGDAMLVI